MSAQLDRFQVTLISGKIIEDLTHEEATKYFYSHASSRVEPWPVRRYTPPGAGQ